MVLRYDKYTKVTFNTKSIQPLQIYYVSCFSTYKGFQTLIHNVHDPSFTNYSFAFLPIFPYICSQHLRKTDKYIYWKWLKCIQDNN